MTRDQKLALIVGFSVVLLVGILISDHFSRARNTQVTKVDPAEPVRVARNESGSSRTLPSGATFQPPAQPRASTSTQGNASLWPETAVPITEPAPPTGAGADAPTGSRLGMSGEIVSPSAAKPPLEDAVQQLASRLATGPTATPAAPSQMPSGSSTIPVREPLAAEIASRGGTITERDGIIEFSLASARPKQGDANAGQPNTTPASAPATDSGLPDSPTPKVQGLASVVPATLDPKLQVLPMRQHKVAQGDTLAEISHRYYQDAKLWRKLAKFNGSMVADDGSIRVGSTLKIPPREELVGPSQASQPATKKPTQPIITKPANLTPTSTVAQRDAKPASRPKDASASSGAVRVASNTKPDKAAKSQADSKNAKSSKPATYTVRKGDTLSQIAARALGSSKRVNDLIRANPDLLEDDESPIHSGVVLRLPRM